MKRTVVPVTSYFIVGKTLKSHGTSGQVRVMIEKKYKPYLNPGSFVFFELDGSKVPFRITAIEEGAHVVMSLEDVEAKDQSDALANQEIYIPLGMVRPEHQRAPKHMTDIWADYFILDKNTLSMFPIVRTEEFPQQLMAIIEIEGREIYIPLQEQLISSIDRREKIIYMEIPEGLLTL